MEKQGQGFLQEFSGQADSIWELPLQLLRQGLWSREYQ